jgi:flagellar hook protein FlgE
MSSFSIPLSGLDACSDALNIISNNLANMNTVGYKDQEANFQDLFYQNIGSDGAGDLIQVGAGSTVGSTTTNFANGSLQSTGVDTDVAITGNGFFVVQGADGGQEYTRAGDFNLNAAGQLITSSGQLVLGYPALNGVVTPGATLSPLQMGQGQISPPSATTTMDQQTNLDASATPGTTYSTTLAVYDSLGNSHVLTFNYTMTSANNWSYQVTLPAADTGGTGNPTVIASGNLEFDSNGNLESPAGGAITGINITGLADGAANMNLTWNLTNGSGNSLMTQVTSASSTSATDQNGYPSGTLQTFSIGSDGTIDGQFSNGQTQALGQLALANFANYQGLQLAGQNSYQATLSSGAAVVGTPNSGGLGSLTGGSLELSNVDISTEFTNLIVVQRAFEADARVITTFDSVGNDTVNLQAAPGN